jgi:hypothetical protein
VTAPLPPPYDPPPYGPPPPYTPPYGPPPPQYGPPPYGPPPYGPPPYGPWSVPAPPRTNPLAITSLVCAIAGLFVFLLPSVPAIVMGAVALHQIRQRGENGEGLALAGIIIGVCGILVAIGAIVLLGVLLHNLPQNCTTGC